LNGALGEPARLADLLAVLRVGSLPTLLAKNASKSGQFFWRGISVGLRFKQPAYAEQQPTHQAQAVP